MMIIMLNISRLFIFCEHQEQIFMIFLISEITLYFDIKLILFQTLF